MATPQGIKAQLIYIQWLRVFLIVMVVAHHGAQPYGPTGGRWPVEDPTNLPWLLYVFATNAAFGMGFFFLISGYFVDRSYDRHGPAKFLAARLVRGGVPLVMMVVFLYGLIAIVGGVAWSFVRIWLLRLIPGVRILL